MGDGQDPAERLAREMQKAADERPFDWRAEGPYAMRENTIGGRLAQEPGPAEVVSEEHHQHTTPLLFPGFA